MKCLVVSVFLIFQVEAWAQSSRCPQVFREHFSSDQFESHYERYSKELQENQNIKAPRSATAWLALMEAKTDLDLKTQSYMNFKNYLMEASPEEIAKLRRSLKPLIQGKKLDDVQIQSLARHIYRITHWQSLSWSERLHLDHWLTPKDIDQAVLNSVRLTALRVNLKDLIEILGRDIEISRWEKSYQWMIRQLSVQRTVSLTAVNLLSLSHLGPLVRLGRSSLVRKDLAKEKQVEILREHGVEKGTQRILRNHSAAYKKEIRSNLYSQMYNFMMMAYGSLILGHNVALQTRNIEPQQLPPAAYELVKDLREIDDRLFSTQKKAKLMLEKYKAQLEQKRGQSIDPQSAEMKEAEDYFISLAIDGVNESEFKEEPSIP